MERPTTGSYRAAIKALLVACAFYNSLGRLVVWSFGHSDFWSFGRSVGRLVGQSVGRSVGWSVSAVVNTALFFLQENEVVALVTGRPTNDGILRTSPEYPERRAKSFKTTNPLVRSLDCKFQETFRDRIKM